MAYHDKQFQIAMHMVRDNKFIVPCASKSFVSKFVGKKGSNHLAVAVHVDIFDSKHLTDLTTVINIFMTTVPKRQKLMSMVPYKFEGVFLRWKKLQVVYHTMPETNYGSFTLISYGGINLTKIVDKIQHVMKPKHITANEYFRGELPPSSK